MYDVENKPRVKVSLKINAFQLCLQNSTSRVNKNLSKEPSSRKRRWYNLMQNHTIKSLNSTNSWAKNTSQKTNAHLTNLSHKYQASSESIQLSSFLHIISCSKDSSCLQVMIIHRWKSSKCVPVSSLCQNKRSTCTLYLLDDYAFFLC